MHFIHRWKSLIAQNWIYYIIGFSVIYAIKLFYSTAGSNELEWILAPTAWWVGILTRDIFERVPQVGYVNHSLRFIIAPSCSGVQFMIIALATFFFSFIHRMETRRKKVIWMALSFSMSYVCTILVNGLRIALSIYLPLYLRDTKIYNEWMTPQQFHSILGIVIYFTSIFFMYRIAERSFHKLSADGEIPSGIGPHRLDKLWMPVFWYFFVVLGLPALNHAYRYEGHKFVEYALLVASVCLLLLGIFYIISILRRFMNKQKIH